MSKLNILGRAGQAVDRHIARTNPNLAQYLGDDDEDEDGDEDERDASDPGEGYVFGLENAEENLKVAVAAYRGAGTKNDVVAQHDDTGIAWCGSLDDWETYLETHGLSGDYTAWEKARDIMDLSYDQNTLRALLSSRDPKTFQKARNLHKQFNWESKSNVTEFKPIAGIDAQNFSPSFIGVACEIVYRSFKDGTEQEYVHTFSEDSGKPVFVYGIGDKTIAINGGGMHIEARGIID